MYQIILLFHVLIAVCVIALVLVQQGKGATMGAAFGSGASQTIFGSRGSGSFLFRFTIGLIAAFFVTSLILNYMGTATYKQERIVQLPMLPQQRAPATTGKTAPVTTSTPTSPVAPVQN